MSTNSSFTAGTTSDIQKRVQLALTEAVKRDKVQAVGEQIRRLDSKGMLRRQRYQEMTTRDFERRYMAGTIRGVCAQR